MPDQTVALDTDIRKPDMMAIDVDLIAQQAGEIVILRDYCRRMDAAFDQQAQQIAGLRARLSEQAAVAVAEEITAGGKKGT